MLIDSHAHLDASAFDLDREDVINAAWGAGLSHALTVGLDLASSRRACELSAQYPGVMAAAGVHPAYAEEFANQKDDVYEFIESAPICAIGEIGLDYHNCTVDRKVQRSAFRCQLAWAKTLNLPVIVHDRDAHTDVMEDLKEYRVRGVLHCFSGSDDMAAAAVELGLYVSFAGNVTYNSATDLQEVACRIPGDRLLIETDSPYLAPVPYRGQRNQPANVKAVAQFIAELRGIESDLLAASCSNNCERLFGWG